MDGNHNRQRGALSGTWVVGFFVLAAFAGIMAAAYMAMQGPPPSRASGMRQVFVAWFTYMSDTDAPPPNLLAVRNRLPSDEAFVSSDDPFAKVSGPFPLEPFKPEMADRSPVRISYGYLNNFRGAEGVTIDAKTWDDPKIGLLADGWQGSITGPGFNAEIPGPILRVHMDGSVGTYKRTDGSRAMSSPRALFYDRNANQKP